MVYRDENELWVNFGSRLWVNFGSRLWDFVMGDGFDRLGFA